MAKLNVQQQLLSPQSQRKEFHYADLAVNSNHLALNYNFSSIHE